MKGLLGAICNLLLTIFINGCESTETRTFVGSFRSRRQAPDESVSPVGYTPFPEDDAAYKIYDGPETTPDEADARCESDGGELAIADTANKIRNIKSIYSGEEKRLFVAMMFNFINAGKDKVSDVSLFAHSFPFARQIFIGADTKCADIFDFEIGSRKDDCTIKAFVCSITLVKYQMTVNEYKAYDSDERIAYKIYNDTLPWKEARARCISDGGDLAIADTVEKIKFIQDMDVSKNDWLSLGIFKSDNPGMWNTVNETKISIPSTLWASWIPPDPTISGKNCVAIPLSETGLATRNCIATSSFVCEIGRSTLLEKKRMIWKPTVNFNYPVGYVSYPRFAAAYKFYDEHLTYPESRKRCVADGGRLAVLDSFDKINVVSDLLGSELVHIGIRMTTVNCGEWVIDADGTPLKDIPWTTGNPHPTKCAALSKNANGLEDIECSRELQFLCEIRRSSY